MEEDKSAPNVGDRTTPPIGEQDSPQKKNTEKLDKFTKWVIFGVLVAIAPIILDVLFRGASATPKAPFHWTTTFERGELVLVATGITGAAVGDLLEAAEKTPLRTRYSAGGGSGVIGFIAAGFYAWVASKVHGNEFYDKSFVVNTSLVIFFFGLIAAAGCVLGAKEPNESKGPQDGAK